MDSENLILKACFDAYLEGRRLPGRVLTDNWNVVRFFDPDFLLAPDFVRVARELMDEDGSNAICGFEIGTDFKIDPSVRLCITRDSTEASYRSDLRVDAAMLGVWIWSSEKGSWCAYADKINDVALMAFRSGDEARSHQSVLDKIHALPIEAQLHPTTAGTHTYANLVPEWRDGLSVAYADRR